MSDDAVRGVLSGTPILLLGFDGPICSVFSGYPARTVADEVPRFVVGQGAPLPAAAMATDDPLEVLAATEQTGDLILTRETAAFLRERETIAAATAELTPGITEVLAEAMRTDRMIVVVSENADSAVHTVLERHGLTAAVDGVIGRHDWMFPHQLTPDPFLVQLALMGTRDTPAVLVGDSVAAVQAAHAAGVLAIGYANTSGNRATLAAAGADAVIDTMTELATALRETPAPPIR